MERLRTQYQFKVFMLPSDLLTSSKRHSQQQELETSNRRGLGTARKARVGAMPPPTPVPLPSQMRNWASGPGPQEGTITSSQARHLRTPTRPRVGLHNRDSPRRRKDANTLPGPSNAPKALNGALPGFQNSFASPSHGSSRRGKRTITRAPPGLDTPTPARSRRGGSGEPPSPPSSPTYGDDIRTAAVFPLMDDQKMSSPGLDMDMDAIGDQELMAPPPLPQLPDQPGLVEEVSVDPIVWRDEVTGGYRPEASRLTVVFVASKDRSFTLRRGVRHSSYAGYHDRQILGRGGYLGSDTIQLGLRDRLATDGD
jgi:hypothetical protein